MNTVRTAVAYYRASTKTQVHSIATQQRNVRSFCSNSDIEIIKEFSEQASGRDDNREGLLSAIAHANFHNSALIVWSVSRLGRNASSTIAHLESNLKIIIAEIGLHAEPMMLSLQAVFAAHEARVISKRVKIGLDAAKARGVKLGCPRPKEASKKAAIARIRIADKHALKIGPLIDMYRKLNLSYRQISAIMNDSGCTTPRGCVWTYSKVFTSYKRFKSLTPIYQEGALI